MSELREKPAGRKPIDTRTVALDRLEEVVDGVGRALANGQRVYWVCPLVDESEKLDLAAAEERFEMLEQRFGDTVELVHGKMKGTEKDRAMQRFASGEARLLVATTVIEVGVDVPEATVMVIEHAERFGLAQLHQLRGRIGRGSEHSTCLLLYKAPLGETAKARLAILRETEDGFRIAEEDLKLRGEGDVLGTRQSGMPGFRLARMEFHSQLLGPGARRRSADPRARPEARGPARTGAAASALSVREGRSGPADSGRVTLPSPRLPNERAKPATRARPARRPPWRRASSAGRRPAAPCPQTSEASSRFPP